MKKKLSKNAVNIHNLNKFLKEHASIEELNDLARILNYTKNRRKWKEALVQEVVKRLYKCYQTPAGYALKKKPTIDQMCDRIAKKLKLRELRGDGWQKLHSLCINIFEKIFKSMTKEEKEKLLKEMWEKLGDEDKKQLKKEFDIADVSAFIHGSELMVVHVVGVYLARETALFAAAAVLRLSLGLALTASTVLTRTANVFLGPLGWALVALSVNDLMGTNFKRIVPALLTINIVNMRVHDKQGREFFDFLAETQYEYKGCAMAEMVEG